jgi:ribonucleoside-diphosphate reductase alpha chain
VLLCCCVLQERLLGVSLTGIMDNRLMSGQLGMGQLESALDFVKQAAVKANADMAAELGFPAAAAVTCVKPSGTVSQLCDSASGIHPRHSEYYIRRVRCNKDDPLTAFMLQVGRLPHCSLLQQLHF